MTPVTQTNRMNSSNDQGSWHVFMVVTHPRLPLILGMIAVLGMMLLILLL